MKPAMKIAMALTVMLVAQLVLANEPLAQVTSKPPAATVDVMPPAKPSDRPMLDGPDALQPQFDAWKAEVDQITAAVQRDGQTDKHLVELRERAERIRAAATALVAAETPRQMALDARLKQLGPGRQADDAKPAPVEAEAVKAERDDQQRQLAGVLGRVKQAQLLRLRAEEIIKSIGDRRRDRFTMELVEQSRSSLDPTLWIAAVQSIPSSFKGLGYLVGDWMRLLAARGLETTAALSSVMIALVALLVLLGHQLKPFMVRDPEILHPPRLRRAALAVSIVALNLLVPVGALMGVSQALTIFGLAPGQVGNFLAAVTAGVGAGAAIYGITVALMAPAKPSWRLAPVGDQTARRLVQLSVALAIVHGVGVTIGRLAAILAAPVDEVIAFAGLFALLDAAIVMSALKAEAHALAGDDPQATGDEEEIGVVWRWIIPIGWAITLGAVVAALAGYVALASFMMTQLIRIGFLVGALYMLLQLSDEWILSTFHYGTPLGDVLVRSMGLSADTVAQIAVVLSGVTRLLLILVMAFAALTPIGVSSKDVMNDARIAFFGFKVGTFTFSPSSILTGLAILVIGVALTRGIEGWLDERFLPRTRLDVGLRNSIRTAVGYVGYVIAAMMAFSVIGLDLQNFAIVAGALSVGIGFGLQSIVNNFVSGLILLAERPIKTGDLIEIGPEKGFVRKINVRSTEIETFDQAALIVPNSSLISGNVKNWMHRDMTGRCVIDIGVAYDADPPEVRDLLLGCATDHAKVLPFPPPGAFLVKFGESALEFRLICMVADVADVLTVESDLRFAIVARLRERGIVIPFAQREVHIRQLDGLRELLDAHLPGGAALGTGPARGSGA